MSEAGAAGTTPIISLSRSGGKGGARRIAALMASLQAKGVDTMGLAARADNPKQGWSGEQRNNRGQTPPDDGEPPKEDA